MPVGRFEITVLVERWIQRLGLQTWDIEVIWPDDKRSLPEREGGDLFEHPHQFAFVYRPRDHETARVWFNEPQLEALSAKQLEVTVVHELLHLVMREVDFIGDLLIDQLHRDVDKVIQEAHESAVEKVTDRLAHRFVELANRP